MTEARNTLLISQDVIAGAMAGPGIRYYQLAHALAAHVPVTLAIPDHSPAWDKQHSFNLARYTPQQWDSLAPLVNATKVVIFPSDLASEFPQLAQSDACLVMDGYDPQLAEWLSLTSHLDVGVAMTHWQQRAAHFKDQFATGDFFLCASERQRFWWLGLLESAGRLNPLTYRQDASFRKLLDVVPMGVPAKPPIRTKPIIKGIWPGIGENDTLLLWGGGLWTWLDPLTAIRAVTKASKAHPRLRLAFPGTRRPNTALAGIPTQETAARQLAEELGVLNTHVFFGEWVAYEDWGSVLLESDLALMLHHDTIETQLAFRTRALDCIWAGLPVVATEGEAMSEWMAARGLGCVAKANDAAGVASAIQHMLAQPEGEMAGAFDEARKVFSWQNVAKPLIQFCLNPQRAADRSAVSTPPQEAHTASRLQQAVARITGKAGLMRK